VLNAAKPSGVRASRTVQPFWVRLTHWLSAVAIVLMVMSGWQVYNASPLFPAWTFPTSVTLGGWLGGALMWHFAAMWLLFGSFVVYLLLNILTGRIKRRYWPVSPRLFATDAWAALRGRLSHTELSTYNAVQKVAYLAVSIDLIVLILSGLTIWKPVQFPLLRALFGGYDFARFVHFFAMSFVVLFFVVHIVMVALVPRSLLLMIRGR